MVVATKDAIIPPQMERDQVTAAKAPSRVGEAAQHRLGSMRDRSIPGHDSARCWQRIAFLVSEAKA